MTNTWQTPPNTGPTRCKLGSILLTYKCDVCVGSKYRCVALHLFECCSWQLMSTWVDARWAPEVGHRCTHTLVTWSWPCVYEDGGSQAYNNSLVLILSYTGTVSAIAIVFSPKFVSPRRKRQLSAGTAPQVESWFTVPAEELCQQIPFWWESSFPVLLSDSY